MHIQFCARGAIIRLFVCKVMHIQFCARLFVCKVMDIHAVALSQSIDCSSPDKQKISFLILPAAAYNLQNLIKRGKTFSELIKTYWTVLAAYNSRGEKIKPCEVHELDMPAPRRGLIDSARAPLLNLLWNWWKHNATSNTTSLINLQLG